MKKHIKFFLVAAIALVAANSFAQNGAKLKPKMAKLTLEQRAMQNADSLKVRLSLSDAQYAKVVPINVEFFKARETAMKAQKSDTIVVNQSIYKAQIKTAYQTRKKAINAILNSEQKERWKTWKKMHTPKKGKVNAKVERLATDDIDANEPQ